MAAIFNELKGHYGAPRIERELRRRGHCTSKKRVAASMARQGLVARPRRRWQRTTDSSHREPIAPNRLARDFTPQAPDRTWVADTTYLPVLGGFIYLVFILDLFSRKVVGWAVDDHLDAQLSGEALRRAFARRRPGPGLLFHSDRGFEFAARSFRQLLLQAGAVQSMSRKGNCWDNAVAESFFSTLSTISWRTVEDAGPELGVFIESYYNARRLHSTNDCRNPNETEAEGRWRHKLGPPNRGKPKARSMRQKTQHESTQEFSVNSLGSPQVPRRPMGQDLARFAKKRGERRVEGVTKGRFAGSSAKRTGA